MMNSQNILVALLALFSIVATSCSGDDSNGGDSGTQVSLAMPWSAPPPAPVNTYPDVSHYPPQPVPMHPPIVKPAHATIKTVQSGLWGDNSTWEGGAVPVHGDRVWIQGPHSITLDYQLSGIEFPTVLVDGELTFDPTKDTFLAVDTFQATKYSSVTMGTVANPIAANVTCIVEIADHNNGFEQFDANDIDFDPKKMGQGMLIAGHFECHGAEKDPFAVLQNTVSAGASQLRLKAAPLGWEVGDTIVVAGTKRDATGEDLRQITSITGANGNKINLSSQLTFSHTFPTNSIDPNFDPEIHVINLTRNLTVRTKAGNRDKDANDIYDGRGHIMFMRNEYSVKYLAMEELGRTNKVIPIDDLIRTGTVAGSKLGIFTVVATPANPRARYPLHFHRTNRADVALNAATVHGCAIWGTPGWGYVNHSAWVHMTNNVAFDCDGSSFVTEAGDEKGSIVGNVSIKSHGTGGTRMDPRINEDDFGHSGSGIWLEGIFLDVRDNVCTGTTGHAVCIYPFPIDGFQGWDPDNAWHPERYTNRGVKINTLCGWPLIDQTCYGCELAFAVGKTHPTRKNWWQYQDIINLTCWNCENGIWNQYSNGARFHNTTLIGDVDNPSGYGLRMSTNSDHFNYFNMHVEGFMIGMIPTQLDDRGFISGAVFKNFINVFLNRHVLRRSFRADWLGLKFVPISASAETFGKAEYDAISSIAGSQLIAGAQLVQPWGRIDVAGQTNILIHEDITVQGWPNHTLNVHLNIDLSARSGRPKGLYRIYLKREQSPNFIPYPSSVWASQTTPHVDMGLKNSELVAAGKDPVWATLLPGNWLTSTTPSWVDNTTWFDGAPDGFQNIVLEYLGTGIEAVNPRRVPKVQVYRHDTATDVDTLIASSTGENLKTTKGQTWGSRIMWPHETGVPNIAWKENSQFDKRGWDAISRNIYIFDTSSGPPVIGNDRMLTHVNTAVTRNVLSNDVDPDNTTMTIVSVGTTPDGTGLFSGSNVTFTPKANWYGLTELEYTVKDAAGNTTVGVILIQVLPS